MAETKIFSPCWVLLFIYYFVEVPAQLPQRLTSWEVEKPKFQDTSHIGGKSVDRENVIVPLMTKLEIPIFLKWSQIFVN